MPRKRQVKKSSAGRKPIRGKKKEVMAITLTPEAIDFINSLDKSRGEAIEDLIRESKSFKQWKTGGKKFAWDKFLSQCLYKDLRELLPCDWPIVPSMYSPDGAFYLASSIDVGIDLSDVAELKSALAMIADELKAKPDHIKAMNLRIDLDSVIAGLHQLHVSVNRPEAYIQGK